MSTMLRVITEVTGLRLSLIAHVTDAEWTCAVNATMAFGLEADPVYCAHHTPARFRAGSVTPGCPA